MLTWFDALLDQKISKLKILISHVGGKDFSKRIKFAACSEQAEYSNKMARKWKMERTFFSP